MGADCCDDKWPVDIRLAWLSGWLDGCLLRVIWIIIAQWSTSAAGAQLSSWQMSSDLPQCGARTRSKSAWNVRKLHNSTWNDQVNEDREQERYIAETLFQSRHTHSPIRMIKAHSQCSAAFNYKVQSGRELTWQQNSVILCTRRQICVCLLTLRTTEQFNNICKTVCYNKKRGNKKQMASINRRWKRPSVRQTTKWKTMWYIGELIRLWKLWLNVRTCYLILCMLLE